MEVEAVAYDFDKRPPDDHPCKIWLYLDQAFRGDCFKFIFSQNQPNLHISAKDLGNAKCFVKSCNMPYLSIMFKFQIIKQMWLYLVYSCNLRLCSINSNNSMLDN